MLHCFVTATVGYMGDEFAMGGMKQVLILMHWYLITPKSI